MPICPSARGREPSITTSAAASSSAQLPRPSSCAGRVRPTRIDRGVRRRRPASAGRRRAACVLSTVITRAPSRARTSAASGPAHSDDRFTTIDPPSGRPGSAPRLLDEHGPSVGHLPDHRARQPEHGCLLDQRGARPVGDLGRHDRPEFGPTGARNVGAEPGRNRSDVVGASERHRDPTVGCTEEAGSLPRS